MDEVEAFKSLSSFANVTDLSRSPKIVVERVDVKRRNHKHCASTSDGRDFRWRGGGMEVERTSRDKTGKEGMISTSRWCASARTAYSSSTLSSSCHHRGQQRYPRHSRPPLSKIRIRGRSRGRPIGWPRPRSPEWPLLHGE